MMNEECKESHADVQMRFEEASNNDARNEEAKSTHQPVPRNSIRPIEDIKAAGELRRNRPRIPQDT
jgi:hypothetical protein